MTTRVIKKPVSRKAGPDLADAFRNTIKKAHGLVRAAELIGEDIIKVNERLRTENQALKSGSKRKRTADDDEKAITKKAKKNSPQPIRSNHVSQHRAITPPQRDQTNTDEAVRNALMAMPAIKTSQPRGLRNPSNRCFANAVIQCLSTIIDPVWLKQWLGDHIDDSNTTQTDPIRRALRTTNRLEERDYQGMQPIIAALLRLLHSLQNSSDRQPEIVDPLLRSVAQFPGKSHLNGQTQQDCIELLTELIDSLSEGGQYPAQASTGTEHKLIEALFRVVTVNFKKCRDCGEPRTNNGEIDWCLNFQGEPKWRSKSITQLLKIRSKPQDSTMVCIDPGCGKQGMIKSRFDGIAKLPEFLIIRCHRGTDGHLDKDGNWVVPYLKYQLKLERTLDMTEYAVNDTTRTKYVLRGIIKHRGESLNSGHYVAYTEGSGGNWWECNDENIKKIKFEDIEKTVGLTYVLFYQRLPETGDGG